MKVEVYLLYISYIICVFILDGPSRISRVAANTGSPRANSSILNTSSYQSSRRNSVDSLDESTPNYQRDYRVKLNYLIYLYVCKNNYFNHYHRWS